MPATGRSGTRAFQVYATTIHLIVLVLLLRSALGLTDGRLIYTLDDPYIHLALAESILEGGHGINEGEFASPSSSILYPLVLAVGLLAGLGVMAPLVLSVPFALAATWLLAGFIWRALAPDDSRLAGPVALLLGPAIVLATNAAALPMTGMEHSIHIFATVLALVGLRDLSIDPERRAALAAVAVGTLLCVTIRFEGLALALGVLAALFAYGLRRQSVTLGAVLALVLGTYAMAMSALGLPVFPSSVMAKSGIAAQAADGNASGLVAGLAANIRASFDTFAGVLLALGSAVLATAALAEWRGARRRGVFLLTVAFILSAHVAAGRYGWFGRYEVYAVAAMLLGLASVRALARRGTASLLGAPILLVLIGAPYLSTTLKTPAASANVYQQQYQMHRFVQEFFPEPVAVNDLGLVAFGNDMYVLDLWGLGSEEVRRLRASDRWTHDILREITRRRDITFAMIYIEWIRQVPGEWCHIADLVTSEVSSGSDTVSFYLIRRDREDDMRVALRDFAVTLPAGARLEIRECEADA